MTRIESELPSTGGGGGGGAEVTRATLGLSEVDNTSDHDKPISEDTANALAVKVDDGTLVLDLRKQPGVVGDGEADDSAAINAAAASALALGLRLFAAGTFRIDGTVYLFGPCDLSLATFRYYGTGTAIQVGDGFARVERKNLNLPSVIAANKIGVGWATVPGTTGIKVINAYSSNIYTPYVYGFAIGFQVFGLGANALPGGTGNVYNVYKIDQLYNNQVQLDLAMDEMGWNNENKYFISRSSYASAEGDAVAGTRNIRLSPGGFYSGPNNNIFFGGSIEGNTPEYHIECSGVDNRFLHLRYENPGGVRIWWRNGSQRNILDGGNALYNAIETYEAGVLSPATVLSGLVWKLRGSASTKGLLHLENSSSYLQPAITIMPPGSAVAGKDPVTEYTGKLTSGEWTLKGTADAFDKIKIDGTNGRIYIGRGAEALVRYFANYSTTGTALNGGGNFQPGTDIAQDLGIASFRWRDAYIGRYLRAATAVQTGSFTTATRPSAITAGAGASIYDTTLGRLVYSDGAAWKDPAVAATDVEITDATKGIILKSPSGTRFRVTVANDGSLTTTAA